MRVIGGSAGGRRLSPPRDRAIRPTADRVKEALFNILTGIVGSFDGHRVLDVFAGAGSLGIEALSRGARDAVFVDNSRDAVKLITHNLAELGLSSRATVVAREALTALKSSESRGDTFSLVFLDPPYTKGLTEKVLEYLATSRLLADGAVVVAEVSSRETLPPAFGRLQVFDRRVYGDTAVLFLSFDGEG
ncbi:MAG TPA: 16S rRNA (guanine(966)-N(2))-methyltransferase RsmD [Geobacteraceae bacterium]